MSKTTKKKEKRKKNIRVQTDNHDDKRSKNPICGYGKGKKREQAKRMRAKNSSSPEE